MLWTYDLVSLDSTHIEVQLETFLVRGAHQASMIRIVIMNVVWVIEVTERGLNT